MSKDKRTAFYEMTVEMSVPQWNIFRWKIYVITWILLGNMADHKSKTLYTHINGSTIQLLSDSANSWASDFESIPQSKWSRLQV